MKVFDYTFPAGSWRGNNPTVKARRVAPGLIVVTKDGPCYRVTHEATGLGASRDFDKLKDALARAEAMSYLLDWTLQTAEAITKQIHEYPGLAALIFRIAHA